jgi:serine/threonine protein kinase/signal transduction histidine kinase
MNMDGKTLNNQYTILNQIGEGGMSFVFKARDLKHQREVAVKFIKENITSNYYDDIIRFKKEIDTISKLNHPNIIKIYDAGEYEHKLYYVMELLPGANLTHWLQNNQTFTETTIINIMIQLAEALKYVHYHGIIHRDLKPGNVLISNQDGSYRIKLLDFGVALIMELGKINEKDLIAGTFGYMSPEATGILDKRIDERSDLYSLGVIFYHLLTQTAPFNGNSVNQLLHHQVAYLPPEPSKKKPGIPLILDNIVMKLLAKDPDLRYQSAQGLLYDLKRYETGETDFLVGEKDQKVKITYQTKLIGREIEIGKIKGLYNKADNGKGSICLITGEAGIGKSRLVEEFKRYIYEKNGLFFRGRCLNHSNKIPYQPFKDIVDEYTIGLEKADTESSGEEISRIKNILGDLIEAIVKLNPRLENLIGKTQKLPPIEPERETQRFLMALADFFCNLAEPDRVCVLFLDDLQWADDGSLHLLQEILRKIKSYKLLILGTYRDNEIGSDHRLITIINESKNKKIPLTEIKLAPITLESINTLLASIIGGKEDQTGKLAEFLYEKSRGNPFFAINILRELIENKALVLQGNYWDEDWLKIHSFTVSNNIVDIIIKRIEKLNPEQIALLGRAAVIGKEFNIELLYKLTNLIQDQVVNMIDEFLFLQLLEKSPERGRLLFAHDRIRDAFYSQLKLEERRRIHYQIAKTIEELNQNDVEKVIFELAYHFMESQVQEESLLYIVAAADKARLSYANEEAIKYYQAAINIIESKEDQNNNWLKLNEELIKLLLVIGRNDEVISKAQNILPMIEEPIIKARFFNMIGVAFFKKGCWNECESNIISGLALFGEKIPIQNSELFLSITKDLIIHIFHSAFGWYFKSKQKKALVAPKDIEIIWMYKTLSWLYILSDVKKLIHSILRMMNIAESRLTRSNELAQSIAGYAGLCMAIPLFKRGLKNNQTALSLREELRDEWGVAQCLQFFGFNYAWQGDYQEGIKYFDQALAKFLQIGDLWELGMVYIGLGFCNNSLGDFEKCIRLYNQYLDISHKINDIFGVIGAHIGLSMSNVKIGNYEEALSLINSVINSPEIINSKFNHCCALIILGIIEIENANYDIAIKALHDAESLDKENSFLKNYSTLTYPYLAEAYIKKNIQIQTSSNTGRLKKKYLYILSLCKKAKKETRAWATNFGITLRAWANYYVLISKNNKAIYYFEKSIRHMKRYYQRYELAKTYYEYGEFLSSFNKNQANICWLEAYRYFKEINNNDYIERCAKSLGINDSFGEKSDEPKLNFENTNRDRLAIERRMETVITTSRYISSILELDSLLNKIIDSAIELVGAERGILMLYPETGERRLELKVFRNITPKEINNESPISSSIISQIEADQHAIIISDALNDEKYNMKSSVVLHEIRSVLAAPIMLRGQLLGILYLDNHLVSGLFDEDDLKTIDVLLSQAGISIENARLYNNLAALNQNLENRVQERTNQLENLNQELIVKNDQLKQHAATIEELAVAKERNRMAGEVHDTLGHTMTSIKALLDLSLVELNNSNFMEVRKGLHDALEFTKEGIGELRRSILGLSSPDLESNGFIDAVKSLIIKFESLGVHIDFSVDDPDQYRSKNINFSITVYRLCQEALTNAVRHGKAKNISIIIRTLHETVRISIIDDGCGCKSIHKGFGLAGMEQRVKNLNGKLLLVSDGEQGFNIHVEIPVERPCAKGVDRK